MPIDGVGIRSPMEDLAFDGAEAAEQLLIEPGATKPARRPGEGRWTVLPAPPASPSGSAPPPRPPVPTPTKESSAMMNSASCLAVKDPLATAAFYDKLGFGVLGTVDSYDRTGREFFFRDLDGYIIGVFGPNDIDAFRKMTGA
ncbi:hypothetical protein AB0D04_07765 [Streptomyces sp. NPDC048483]|uniref:VOC family protein n=1 Tax=Streptomyces sp. NPDC048483 TaxID=3154927 RepID=UPI0034463D52